MTQKIFYEKVGRRYIPVKVYDSDFIDSLTIGTHLVTVGYQTTSFKNNVDPAYAPMIAAGTYAEDELAKALVKAGELRMTRGTVPLTPGQKAAWENLVKEFGDSAKQLEWPSAREVAQEGVRAMIVEAEKLLANPAVKKSWDNFQLVCKLVNDKAD